MITYPFSVTNNIAATEKTNFYSFIKLMNQKGNSKLLSSPTLTISDEKTTRFSVAETLPFKVSSSTIIDNTQSIINNIEYKDIGLIIDLLPKIYEKNHIFLDMTLNLTNVISNTDNMPITSKKYIKQEFNLSKDEIFILTGLNKKSLVKNKNHIPYLSSIPGLGWLFKSETTDEQEISLSIILEVIEETEILVDKLEELEF
jgi:general secretion pathway protein D